MNKFVIYGQPRTGSTLLVDLLNSHPYIQCDGEVLNLATKYIKYPLFQRILHKYPFPYFNHRRRKSKAPVYGFKILHQHIKYPHYVIKRLHKEGWKIIYTRRQNIVHQAISLIVSRKTGYWHHREDRASPPDTISIDREVLLSEIEKRIKRCDLEQTIMNDIEHLKIVYETDLSEQDYWDATARKLLDYLAIEFHPLRSSKEKTYTRPYKEMIQNYAELMDDLRAADYGYLLKGIADEERDAK